MPGLISVRKLSQLSGRASEDVIAVLRSMGYAVNSERSSIARSSLGRVRAALGIDVAGRPVTEMQLVRGATVIEDVVLARTRPAVPAKALQPTKPRRSKLSPAAQNPWRIVGKGEPIRSMEPDEVERIHWCLVEDFRRSRDPIDPPGLRDRSLLESAVYRPYTSLAGQPKYPTVSMAGAALFHALVHNHAFHNGNKRTGLVSLIVFLDKHGYVLQISEDELFDYVLALASHDLGGDADDALDRSDREMLEVARWLQRHMRPIQRREHVLKFRELWKILSAYGCTHEVMSGNKVNIYRGSLQTQVWYGGEGTEAPQNAIHKIRHDLELDEQHGYDSAVFYERRERIPEFITKYRGILDRLAEYDRLAAQG